MSSRYLKYITSEHRRPKFKAVVDALTSPLDDVQNFLASMAEKFNIFTAQGTQLDATGLWIGRTRWLPVPIDTPGLFFSWNLEEPDTGWGFSVWQDRFDPQTKLTELEDDSFRRLLQAKIAANSWDGTTPDAYEAWDIAFSDTGGIILLQDNQDMTLTLGLLGMDPDKVTIALFTSGYLPLKPEGVRIASFVVAPFTRPSFGFDRYDLGIKGVDEGYWRDPGQPDFDPLMAWNCDSTFLRGWGYGYWGQAYGAIDYSIMPDDSSYPALQWNLENFGWGVGWWVDETEPEPETELVKTPDRLWGGRLKGDAAVLWREPLTFGGSARQGWGAAIWI